MNPYVIGGGLAIIATLGLLLNHNVQKVGELRAKLDDQKAETQEAADANTTNMETITSLQDALGSCQALRRAEADEREALLVERSQELAAARIEAQRLREIRDDEQAENQNCADLSGLSIGSFCPATADSLRQRSSGPGSDGDGDG